MSRWWCLVLSLLVACAEPPVEETGPLPADPPEQQCDDAVLTPITSVHEHLMALDKLEILRGHMQKIDVGRFVLLPFLENHREQNPLQLKASLDDDMVISFITVDPHDPEAAQQIIDYVEQGAVGVKLFSGHGMHHTPLSLVSPNAWLIYQTIQELGVPLLMHVNSQRYDSELLQVLDAFPDMRVLCPHYCLVASKIHRLHALFEKYPNLYTDPSFGRSQIVIPGVMYIDENAPAIRAVVRAHADRFLFGTDLPVGTSDGNKATADILARLYRDMLEKESFHFLDRDHNGLALDKCTLEKIYRTNAEAFLKRKPPR